MGVVFRCAIVAFVLGCAGKHTSEKSYDHEDGYGGIGAFSGVGSGGGGRGSSSTKRAKRAKRPEVGSRAPSPPSPMMKSESSFADESVEAEEEPDAKGDTKDGDQPRMVHYNGHVRLEVSRPDETIATIVARAKEIGGYVERETQSSVSLRVPVASFRETYDWVLGQGDVLSRSMSARDVTDAHFAMDLRMRTARKTRDRLQALLARAEDENTKIALLRQIQRLTEQVDRMERQLKTLEGLASMSRLTVEAQSRAAMVGARDTVPIRGFGWIGGLSPFSRGVAQSGEELELSTPEGLVALSDQDHFQAESPDGVILWTARLENRPEGTAEFWMAAIKERIAEEFGTAETGAVGEYLTLRLVAPSEEPYTYIIALKVDGDELHLVEIYYPTAEAEKRHRAQIEAVLGGGAS